MCPLIWPLVICRCSPLRLHWRCCLCNGTASFLFLTLFFFFKILLLYFQLLILWYAVPQVAVDPQRLIQRETTAHAGHLAAKWAPDAQHATPLCGHGFQARATKCVVAEEDSGNMLAPCVALEAHATVMIFNEYHGTKQEMEPTRENVWGVYMNGLFRSFKDVASPAREVSKCRIGIGSGSSWNMFHNRECCWLCRSSSVIN